MSVLKPVLVTLTVMVVVDSSTAAAQREERAIYASVLDKVGAPVTALTAADFIVREDGVQREVLRVSPAADRLQIAVLVDTSQAIHRHLNDLRTAMRSFFKEMHGRHEIAVWAFGERPTLLADYTSDLNRLESSIGQIFPRTGSGTYVLDALVEVSRGLRTREGIRPVIVVITTEGPEFSERYHKTVLDELRTANATLHSFILDNRGRSLVDHAAREREFTLAKGATRTGGRREYLLTSMALADRLQELAAELNNQYRVVYARPSVLIAPDKVDVSLTRVGLTIRAPREPPRLRAVP